MRLRIWAAAVAVVAGVAMPATASTAARHVDWDRASMVTTAPSCHFVNGWQLNAGVLCATALRIDATLTCATSAQLDIQAALTDNVYSQVTYGPIEYTPLASHKSIPDGTSLVMHLRYSGLAPGHSYDLGFQATITVPYWVAADPGTACTSVQVPGWNIITCRTDWTINGLTLAPLQKPAVATPASTGADITTADGNVCHFGLQVQRAGHALQFSGTTCPEGATRGVFGQALAFADRSRYILVASGSEIRGDATSTGQIPVTQPGGTYVVDFYTDVSSTSPIVSLPRNCSTYDLDRTYAPQFWGDADYYGARCQLILPVKLPT